MAGREPGGGASATIAVIPAQAGIHWPSAREFSPFSCESNSKMGPSFRWDDGSGHVRAEFTPSFQRRLESIGHQEDGFRRPAGKATAKWVPAFAGTTAADMSEPSSRRHSSAGWNPSTISRTVLAARPGKQWQNGSQLSLGRRQRTCQSSSRRHSSARWNPLAISKAVLAAQPGNRQKVDPSLRPDDGLRASVRGSCGP